jgi:glycosyltransferase involved in cell wall biosynthesis
MGIAHMAAEPLDILAVAPLPYRVDGRGEFQLGGAFYCADLLSGLASLGHRVSALASGPRRSGAGEPEPLPGLTVEWFALDFVTAAKPPPAEYVREQRAIFEAALDRAISERRPNVVLLGSEAQAWYAAEPCQERGVPTLLIAHGVPTAALPAGIYPAGATEAVLRHMSLVSRVVTVAHHLEQILRDCGLDSVETISTVVDTDVFRPRAKDPARLAAHRIESGHFVVGSFSHLRAEKRMLDVVASAERVVRSEPRVVYLVVGAGPCRDSTVRAVAERGLQENFRFLGEVDHSEVPSLVSLADVVVLASEREGCSLVCLEAQASGCPLIVSDIPAGREVVDGGESGLLFELGSPSELAARVLDLSADEDLRGRLAEKGRAASLARSKETWIRAFSEALTRTAAVSASR